MLNRTAVLFFVGMIFVFDIAYSMLSTCQPISTSAAKYSSPENHCTVFSGIIPWVVGVALHPIHGFLEKYEHSLIAGFTIVLGISTIGLWVSTRNLWEAGERQIRTSRSVAAVQARNARRQLPHAEKTAQHQLRAYVGVKSVILKEAEPLAVVEVEFENGGLTPALEFTSQVGFAPDPNIPLIELAALSKATLGAGRTAIITLTAESPFNPLELAALPRGKLFMHIVGRVRYVDIFGTGHVTNLRFACGGPYGPPKSDGRLHVCTGGNTSD